MDNLQNSLKYKAVLNSKISRKKEKDNKLHQQHYAQKIHFLLQEKVCFNSYKLKN